MRTVTRQVLAGGLVVVVLLLALGALPSLLRSGDPYYMTATQVEENRSAADASALSERYRFATTALENASDGEPGRSQPYWRGPLGLKESFTHSPFDEVDALGQRSPAAVDGESVYVSTGNRTYRLTVARGGGA